VFKISELIALMMEAVQSSGMLVNLYQFTLCYIPEDRGLHSHHWEDLKLYWSSPGLMLQAGHMLMSAGNTVLVAGAQEEVRGSV
jgi:hypothetical protein